jgi:gas vesicle protein
VLGLLLAPNSGEETRAYIRDTARDTLDDAVSRGKKVARRGQKAVDDARELLNEAVDAGQGAFREARNS